MDTKSEAYEPRHDKINKVTVRPANTQISLGICPVWSESFCPWGKLWSLATHWVHCEDSDQTGWMPRLIWVFAGHTVTMLVFSWRSSVMSRIIRKPVFGVCNRVRLKTGLLRYRDYFVSWSFSYSKLRYYTIQAVSNKGADQTVRMRRLICVFVVRIWHKLVFLWCGSYHSIPANGWLVKWYMLKNDLVIFF